MFKSVIASKAMKAGCALFTITYEGNSNEYTFVRKVYKNSDLTNYAIIQGYKIIINKLNFEVVSIEKEYETKGKKVSNTTTKKGSKGIVDSIKAEMTAVEQKEEIVEIPSGEVFHKQYSVIKACVESNIPVYLTGPAGSGKNHTLEQIAKSLGLEFYFTNSVQQEFKLTGFIDAGGNYHETEFYKAFTNGGLFFLDEMDASIPEVLVLLNAAIANGYFEFPNGKVTANENFRVVAAGNTLGSGADDAYTGRMVLDQATLDRFAIIEFDYDENIELAIAKGNKTLVEFIHDLRKQANDKGIRATFSYRCIAMVTKLEGAGLAIEKVLTIAVMKGLTKDTINTFETNSSNKYSEVLYNIKKSA